MPDAQVLVERFHGVPVVVLKGHLDFHFALRIGKLLGDVVNKHPTDVLPEMAEVASVDSTMIGVFLRYGARLQRSGAKLKICGPTPAVKEALDVLHVDTFIPVFQDRTSALRAGP
jgi:anti-anti-sigma factor